MDVGDRVYVNWSPRDIACVLYPTPETPIDQGQLHSPGFYLSDVQLQFDPAAHHGAVPRTNYAWAVGIYRGPGPPPEQGVRVFLNKDRGVFYEEYGPPVEGAPWAWCGADGVRFRLLLSAEPATGFSSR